MLMEKCVGKYRGFWKSERVMEINKKSLGIELRDYASVNHTVESCIINSWLLGLQDPKARS